MQKRVDLTPPPVMAEPPRYQKFLKRLLLASLLALALAVADLYVVNLSVYFMSFWVAWSVIK